MWELLAQRSKKVSSFFSSHGISTKNTMRRRDVDSCPILSFPVFFAHVSYARFPHWNVWETKENYIKPHVRESGSCNPRNVSLWNPEYKKIFLVESGILGFGFRNTVQGIRYPTKNWNPESKLHWQRLESSTWNLESTAWSPESKTVVYSDARDDTSLVVSSSETRGRLAGKTVLFSCLPERTLDAREKNMQKEREVLLICTLNFPSACCGPFST